MATDAPVIRTDQLTRRFGETVAVDALCLTVARGEVFGLLGHNGAGKTTTLRLLNGVLNPTSGSATVFGLSPIRDGATVRRRCGVLTETPSLEERLSARQNLRYYADLYGVEEGKVSGRIAELLETFELSQVADAKVGGFSKGMKQRLALARALLHEPELLYLDEPTSGLDPVAAKRVISLIRELSRAAGRTVVLCTHNLSEAESICDRVAVLQRGRLLALGTPAALARRYQHRAQVLIEVAPQALAEAAACVQGFAGLEVKSETDLLRVGGLARERIPDVIAALIARNVAIYRVEPQAASLEDVYFALHRKDAEAHPPVPASPPEVTA
jgi:ABC-2 type transport system ATP-binding protein